MPRSFTIIPAAGHSLRMGQPKLLMPLDGRPLILHTLAAWQASKVQQVVVVVRPGDEALAAVLKAARVEVVTPPIEPPDMKASLAYGLKHIRACYNPASTDCWLVAPADMPGLSPQIIDRLIEQAAFSPTTVLIPTLSGRRGHPVLLPWSLADEVPQLAENEGLSSLIDRHQPNLIACDDLAPQSRQAFADIDTPADLAAFTNSRPPPAN